MYSLLYIFVYTHMHTRTHTHTSAVCAYVIYWILSGTLNSCEAFRTFLLRRDCVLVWHLPKAVNETRL